MHSEPFTGIKISGDKTQRSSNVNKIRIPGLITYHLENFVPRTRQHSPSLCTWIAKSAPWLPRHRDKFLAKEPRPVAGWLRQPTLTYFIAEPLGFTW